MTARIAEPRGHPPQSLAAAYGNGDLLQWLLKRNITPYMHARDNAHKAREMPTDQFKREVGKDLMGKEEPSEIVYFKLYKTQIPVIEQAIDTAALMLGTDK